MIHHRTMGRTGLEVSEICLGTVSFGWKTDETTAFAILDAFHAQDGNFIQTTSRTPEILLPSTSASVSEQIVGRWWKGRGIGRQELFLGTHLHARQSFPDAASFADQVSRACQESLRRLQVSYLDIVIFEWHASLLPIEHCFEAFNRIVRSGVTRYIGAANFPAWRVVDAIDQAHRRDHCRMEAIQTDYSLMTRTRFEPDAMALCREKRLAFFARSPLAGGFLAQRRGAGDIFDGTRRDWLAKRFGSVYGDPALATVADVAARHETSSAQVALAWVLNNPAVTSAVIGVQSVAQLAELLQAAHLDLSAVDLAQLDDATAAEEVRVAPETHRRSERDEWMRN